MIQDQDSRRNCKENEEDYKRPSNSAIADGKQSRHEWDQQVELDLNFQRPCNADYRAGCAIDKVVRIEQGCGQVPVPGR
jgi:hypothetical protein